MRHWSNCVFVCVTFLFGSICSAAHFEVVHEMSFCNSNATVQSNSEGPNEDPQSNWAGNNNSVSSWMEILYAGQASGGSDLSVDIEPFLGSYEEDLPEIYMNADSSASAYLTSYDTIEGILAQGWANMSTVQVGYATGNFYSILSDGSEASGDLVTITISYEGFVSWYGGEESTRDAYVNGGFAGDDLLITLNCQDYDEPQESEILHRFSKLDLQEGYRWDEVSYQVNIGDVIGIHVGVGAHAEMGAIDPEGLDTSANAELRLGVVINSYDGPAPFDPAKADLNGDGTVDLEDFALFASAWLYQVPE